MSISSTYVWVRLWLVGVDGLTCRAAAALLAAALCCANTAIADTGGPDPAGSTAASQAASTGSSAAGVHESPAATRYCNQKSILIRYRWQGPAPTGVQMWIRLDGQSWLPWHWSSKPTEPISFTPPRQGRVAIALAPAAQETADPPAPDDQTLSIVFDWDKPLLRLISARPETANSPTLRLVWSAWDENFASRPISLYWRGSSAEPWRIGASDLPNAGVYEWDLPAEVAGKGLEVSLRAADLAGNCSEATAVVEVPGRLASVPPAAKVKPVASEQPAAPQSAPASAPRLPAGQPDAASLDAERLYQLARQQLGRNNYEVAEDLLRQALQADSDFHQARQELASLLQRRGQSDQAIHEYEVILATRPDNVTAWRNLALAYTTTKDYPKARVTLQKLLAVDANNPETWLNLGDVEVLSGRPDAARQCWEKARSISKADTEVAAKVNKRLAAYVKNTRG